MPMGEEVYLSIERTYSNQSMKTTQLKQATLTGIKLKRTGESYMTLILTFIKRRWREILLVGSVATICILLPLTCATDTGGELTSELTAIAESIDAGLESISEYEELAVQRDRDFELYREEFRGFQAEFSEKFTELSAEIQSTRYDNLGTGDRVIERQILIDESLRLLEEIRTDK